MPHRCWWEAHLQTQAGGQPLRLLVEHQEQNLTPRPPRPDMLADCRVSQQGVVARLEAVQTVRRQIIGDENIGCWPSQLSTALRKFKPPIHSSAPRRLNVVVLT